MNAGSVIRRIARPATIAVLLGATGSAAAAEEPILRLSAFAINTNNRVRTNAVNIAIERWSTPEETANLRAVLLEKGGDALLSKLQKIEPRCGYASISGSLGWSIYYARETPLPDGARKIVLATDRPVSYWEARQSGRSMDYQFSLAEIRIGPDGKGQGKAIPHAQLSFNKETNTLEIENYQREPVRLNEVTVEEPKKK